MLTAFDKRTVLAAISFMRHFMSGRLAVARLPVVGRRALAEECQRCIDELDCAEAEVRAKC